MFDSPLAGIEAATLSQGVAFLYAQAGDLLRRRRDAKERVAEAGERHPDGKGQPISTAVIPALEAPGGVFEQGPTDSTEPPRPISDSLAEALLNARRGVDDYVVGMATLDPSSPAILQAVDQLRSMLEAIYNVDLTFKGERRVPSNETTTRVEAQQVGVYIGGQVNVGGDIAGRDIHKHA